MTNSTKRSKKLKHFLLSALVNILTVRKTALLTLCFVTPCTLCAKNSYHVLKCIFS